MRHIYPLVLGLALVASQAIADESSYPNQSNAPTAPPLAAAPQAKGIENVSSWPTNPVGEPNNSDIATVKAAEQELSPDARPVYLNGGYFEGSQSNE